MIMAKFAPDATIDGMFDVVADSDEMWVCSAQPTAYADIADSDLIGPITLTPGDGNGDFTIGDGDVSGRKITVAAQNGATVTASGTASHVVLADSGDEAIRYITILASNQAVTAANTANVGSWTVSIPDPT